MGEASFALHKSHDAIAAFEFVLARLPHRITSVCTARQVPDSRKLVLSGYFPHVPPDGSVVDRLRDSLSPLRDPPPLVLPVAFEYDVGKVTAHDKKRGMDRVPPSFMAAAVWPTSRAPDVRYQLQSMVLYYGGHYVAVLQKGQGWFLADDRIVTKFSSLERLREEKVSAVVPWSPGRTAGSLTVRSHY